MTRTLVTIATALAALAMLLGGATRATAGTISVGSPLVYIPQPGLPQTMVATITNTGTTPLTITSVAIAGDMTDFVLHSPPPTLPAILAPREQLEIGVTLTPPISEFLTATLVIDSDDPVSPTTNVALDGLSIAGASLNFYDLGFGTAVVTEPTFPRTLVISDDTIDAMTITGIAFSDPEFAQTAGPAPPFDLASGDSATIQLTCTPATLGPSDGFVTITTAAGSAMAHLSCFGNPVLFTEPLAFAPQLLGTTSTASALPIDNSSDSARVISAVTLAGADAADFAIVGGPAVPLTIGADGGIEVFIAFTPSRDGDETAELDITDDDPTTPRTVVTITGRGYHLGIAASPLALDFGSVVIGATGIAAAITIDNTGGAALAVADFTFTLSGPDAAQFVIDATTAVSIPSGGSLPLYVQFAPVAVGAAAATLTIVGDGLPPIAVALTGTGVAPDITASPIALDFGTLEIGEASPPQLVTLENRSPSAVEIASIVASDPAFVVDTSAVHSLRLATGATATFAVAFTPTAAGSAQAQITITIDAPTSPTISVAVTGDAVVANAQSASAGSGCAAGGSPASWPGSLLVVFAAFAVFARRANGRHAKPTTNQTKIP